MGRVYEFVAIEASDKPFFPSLGNKRPVCVGIWGQNIALEISRDNIEVTQQRTIIKWYF